MWYNFVVFDIWRIMILKIWKRKFFDGEEFIKLFFIVNNYFWGFVCFVYIYVW